MIDLRKVTQIPSKPVLKINETKNYSKVKIVKPEASKIPKSVKINFDPRKKHSKKLKSIPHDFYLTVDKLNNLEIINQIDQTFILAKLESEKTIFAID